MNYQQLWSNLNQLTQERLHLETRELQFKRGQYVYQVGEIPQGLYFIDSGLVGLTVVGVTGKEHLLRFFKKGQFFGHRSILSDELYHGSSVCLEACVIRMLPKSSLINLLDENPLFYKDIALVLAKELRRAENQHVMVLENQMLARVAQTLVFLKQIDPVHLWTRQEIANFCASTTSTVIKTMALLEEMRLIRQKGRVIEILDRQGLLDLESEE
jgi:CRP-like cAMP-binding protein